MNKITVIGSSNTDMIIKVPHIPKPGETILGGNFLNAAGGKGANQAVAAARAGGKVNFIAKLGDDMMGKSALEGFLKDNINTNYIFIDKKEPSGVAFIFVSEEGENSIAVAPGANMTLNAKDILYTEQEIINSKIVLMQLETPIETLEIAADIARKNGATTILNPAPAQTLNNNLLSKIDIITPNETETEMLTGITISDIHSLKKAATMLQSKGVKTIIITLGAKGAYIYNDDYNEIIPGFKVNATDTTAAGDTFNGALATLLANGKDIKQAIQFANAAAALSVTKMGAQSSIPYLQEIETLIGV